MEKPTNKLLDRKIEQFKAEFKKISNENNLFYTYLSGFISALSFCFLYIFTRELKLPIAFSLSCFLVLTFIMKNIYKKHEAIYVFEEVEKYKNSL
ncbi:hypothetical protein [Burkholderia vietnamiensis]|uniref:hypothetical protein n=1 Tax=Burkholderia vietnamiensis TaxID=60552 RepID=UPI00158A07B4|nr:hypothetical protein [Burkholderia vietnamiensis]